jgi:FixJ family two-component response regulator
MNKQIANGLLISKVIQKMHRGRAMQKLGARSTVGLGRMAEILNTPRCCAQPARPNKGGIEAA